MNRKILCVDDDPNILNGFKRALRKDFEIYTAEGGIEALNLIKNESEFAVIVSDMRMPGMNGVQFLEEVQKLSLNSVRMMLTGNADQQTAIDAINNGNIFRFLTKPCEIENMVKFLNAGIDQYRLVTAEKQLLNETLSRSLEVLIEILSMVNPTAFSRSNRIKRMVRKLAERCGIKNAWEVEVAAMLSQIGCVTVDEEILWKISVCDPLNEAELQLYHHHPQIGHDLIAKIPRMETVAKIIAHQNRRFNDETESDLQERQTTLGVRILKLVLDFHKLLDAGNLPHHAFHELSTRVGWYDRDVLNTLKELINESKEEFVTEELDIKDLKPGMFLNKPIVSNRGVLMLSAGQEITLPLILRLTNFAESRLIAGKIEVNVAVGSFQLKDIEQTETAGSEIAGSEQPQSLSIPT